MVQVIEPKATIVDYGPKKVLERELVVSYTITENGNVLIPKKFLRDNKIIIPEENLRVSLGIGPDQIGRRAALVTFKGIDVLTELIELGQTDTDEKVTESIIASAGAGHASLSTTPGFWVLFGGTCSKLVDAIFTPARYGSFLMPSGRRVPISAENIVAPRTVYEAGGETLALYMNTSQANIKAYEELQKEGRISQVSKEEAAKIVQYGHKGGGFGFIPLETLVYFARTFETNADAVPDEAKEIIAQLEPQIYNSEMEKTYESRKAAPRSPCPNPNIFHFRKNRAQELTEQNLAQLVNKPILLEASCETSQERDARIFAYLEKCKQAFSSPENIKKHYRELQAEYEAIIEDFHDSAHAKTLSLEALRVWGEDKRHRHVIQMVESVYNALKRAEKKVNQFSDANFSDASQTNKFIEEFSQVLSIPRRVKENNQNLTLWLERFSDSVRAYQELVFKGIPERDAIMIIPRGLKVGTTQTYDLYDLTAGKMSLRLCTTCEPEMRAKTEAEAKLFLESDVFSPAVKALIVPKCHYVGFCPDTSFCERILPAVPYYKADLHKQLHAERAQAIKDKLSQLKSK